MTQKPNHGKLKEEERKKTDKDEWSDDDGSDMEDDSDSDSSDSDDKKKDKKKDKTLNPKNASLGASKKMADDKKRKDFFGDL